MSLTSVSSTPHAIGTILLGITLIAYGVSALLFPLGYTVPILALVTGVLLILGK